ncbi:MAG: trypsin-like peptidase domain-containing protein [Clostridia bacterium]|nr:trypsin-like peptidase domain-containing protein [Clostridia bacterium]
MENNNWYNNNSGNYSYSSDGGYDNGKKKKGVTIGQLIACLLVVALISGGLGVYFSDSIVNRNQPAPEGGSMIVEEPDGSDKATDLPQDQAATPAPQAQQPGAASDKLTISDANQEANTTSIVQNCMASVVGVFISESTTTFTGETEEQDTGAGSGVIITTDGYIVTNNHVVEGLGNINVYLQDGTKYPATLIGTDNFSDLAVIKIEAENLPAATLGNSVNTAVGSTVYAIGNPLGVFTSSVSRGIISGLDRTLTIDGVSMTLMQTDAAVNPGNSGGGLFNAEGELIGVVNAKTASVDVEGLGFAIPIDSAKPIISDLMDKGYVTGRPYIGISMQDVSLRYGNGSNYGYGYFGFDPFSLFDSYITRVQVMAVEEGSAAEAGGMLVNDIITAVDGKEISGTSQLAALLYEYNVGDTVTITVLRGNETKDLTIVLSERS